MNILFICLGSYIVKDPTGSDPDNFDRQTLYAITLNSLINLKPADAKIIIVDNTVPNSQHLHGVLSSQLNRPEIDRLILLNNNSIGIKNKGAGEYSMCRAVLTQAKDLLEKCEWVIYYTMRHPMFEGLILDYIKQNQAKDAIVGSVDYLYSDGKIIKGGEGVFDDVIFAMKTNWFYKYIDSMSPEELAKKKMSSEQNLYNFAKANRLNYKEVFRWGLLRYNYVLNEMEVV